MQNPLIIWVALVFSTVIYLVVALTMGGETGDFEQIVRTSPVLVLYGLALLMFLAAWFVVPRMIRSAEPTRMITLMAIFEACAIFGLMAAFFTRDWRLYLAPWALTLMGFMRERPGRGS